MSKAESPRKLTPKKRAFLAAYAKTAQVTAAAEAAKVERATHYKWLKEDPYYAELFEQAKIEAAEMLEAEAVRRANIGVDEPVFYQGVECGKIRKYSDTLMIFLLKGMIPRKFRDNATIEHTGPGGGPVSVEVNFVKPAGGDGEES